MNELARTEAVNLVMKADQSMEATSAALTDVRRRLFDLLSPNEESELESVADEVQRLSERLAGLAELLDENSGNEPWRDRG